ncbi:MAG: class I SAM-dependent methyltransferase [Planctomycetes bacterium]|nr:class I SAM-dependent methyltransferase [Planctomycetota bacterium]
MPRRREPRYVEYPEYYDGAHAQTQDLEFFLDYARQCGSPILELACGTGRLLVPVAEAGHTITGLDLSPGMLSICRRRVEDLGLSDRASLVEADMAGFDLPEKEFALAYIPLRSFAHLFSQDQQLACLRSVHDHLRSGGVFIVVAFALNHAVAAREPETSFGVLKEFDVAGRGRVVQSQRFLGYDPASQILHFEFRFEERDDQGRTIRESTVPMTLRYTSRYELQLLMERVGFEVVDVFRDYERRPFNGKYEIIMVGRKA